MTSFIRAANLPPPKGDPLEEVKEWQQRLKKKQKECSYMEELIKTKMCADGIARLAKAEAEIQGIQYETRRAAEAGMSQEEIAALTTKASQERELAIRSIHLELIFTQKELDARLDSSYRRKEANTPQQLARDPDAAPKTPPDPDRGRKSLQEPSPGSYNVYNIYQNRCSNCDQDGKPIGKENGEENEPKNGQNSSPQPHKHRHADKRRIRGKYETDDCDEACCRQLRRPPDRRRRPSKKKVVTAPPPPPPPKKKVPENTCPFCLEEHPKFGKNKYMNRHFEKNCPMLIACQYCNKIVEISKLDEHRLNKCAWLKDQMTSCPICTQACSSEELRKHKQGKDCPGMEPLEGKKWCRVCDNRLVVDDDDAWRKHLIGRKGCAGNERRELSGIPPK